jgi:stage III sporulation protein AF
MDNLLVMAKNIVYYLLIGKILTALVPDGTMKRYIKFFLGIILIIIVVRPILSISNIEDSIINSITEKKSTIDYENLIDNTNIYAGVNADIAIDIYKEQISNQIIQLLSNEAITIKEIRLEIDENQEEESFGNLISISLRLTPSEDNLIEKVSISSIENTNGSDTIDYEGTLIKKRVKNILINFYNLPSDNINIIVENN